LVKDQEAGTAGHQQQGVSVAVSLDGRVMVQGAHYDNGQRGSPSLLSRRCNCTVAVVCSLHAGSLNTDGLWCAAACSFVCSVSVCVSSLCIPFLEFSVSVLLFPVLFLLFVQECTAMHAK
jgi:hypothetical protein